MLFCRRLTFAYKAGEAWSRIHLWEEASAAYGAALEQRGCIDALLAAAAGGANGNNTDDPAEDIDTLITDLFDLHTSAMTAAWRLQDGELAAELLQGAKSLALQTAPAALGAGHPACRQLPLQLAACVLRRADSAIQSDGGAAGKAACLAAALQDAFECVCAAEQLTMLPQRGGDHQAAEAEEDSLRKVCVSLKAQVGHERVLTTTCLLKKQQWKRSRSFIRMLRLQRTTLPV